MAPELVKRCPTVEEYARLIEAVGFKPRDPSATRAALAGSIFAVCGVLDGEAVGMGRVIGDGGLHYYLSDIVVHPAHQRRGLGSQIVRALTAFIEQVPFKNTWVGIFPVDGTAGFYARFGYKTQRPTAPAMYRWLNQGEG